nr:immunoglobulin heavy chain junction region [Mus musculus]
CTRLGFAFW